MKKSIHFLVFIFCLLTGLKLSSQNDITVNLTRIVYPTFYSKLKCKPVINLYDLNKACLSSLKNQIGFPKLNLIPTDTAYGEITRKSTEINSFKTQYYILVFNYSSSAPIVYTSDSYDFRSSSGATLMHGRVLKMPIITDMNGRVNYFLQKDTTQYAKIPISAYAKDEDCEHVKGNNTLRLSNDFAKAGDWETKKTKFSLAIYDANQDGVFNQPGVDKLFLGTQGEDYFELFYDEKNAVNSALQEKDMILEIGNQKFTVVNIDRNGSSVQLKSYKGEGQAVVKKLEIIPDLKVMSSSGDSLNLKKLITNKKYIYLNIWWEHCPPCIREIPVLDSIAEKYKSKLTFLGLLDQSNLPDLKEIIKKYNIKSAQALSNPEVNINLIQDGYPYGILFSDTGELIKTDVDRKQLIEFLNKH
jgi:thiol-disulfide isomerase/thioredoxin